MYMTTGFSFCFHEFNMLLSISDFGQSIDQYGCEENQEKENK